LALAEAVVALTPTVASAILHQLELLLHLVVALVAAMLILVELAVLVVDLQQVLPLAVPLVTLVDTHQQKVLKAALQLNQLVHQ
jgi:hypothetical protein